MAIILLFIELMCKNHLISYFDYQFVTQMNTEMSQLREIIFALQDRLAKADEKNKMQKDVFV